MNLVEQRGDLIVIAVVDHHSDALAATVADFLGGFPTVPGSDRTPGAAVRPET